MAISYEKDKEIQDKGLYNLKIAADRKYTPAEALYGAQLYEENNFEQALLYLTKAEKKTTLFPFVSYFTITVKEKHALNPSNKLCSIYKERLIWAALMLLLL
ncbi:MAG: hypothetical protein GKR94_25755 [Gammaproteobacteria bacterium]|nr:hypothetical protein [Gammaproteobacteria bacterium]